MVEVGVEHGRPQHGRSVWWQLRPVRLLGSSRAGRPQYMGPGDAVARPLPFSGRAIRAARPRLRSVRVPDRRLAGYARALEFAGPDRAAPQKDPASPKDPPHPRIKGVRVNEGHGQPRPGQGTRSKKSPSIPPKAGELKIKMAACGVCHSDLSVVNGHPSPSRSPSCTGARRGAVLRRGDRRGSDGLRSRRPRSYSASLRPCGRMPVLPPTSSRSSATIGAPNGIDARRHPAAIRTWTA